MSGSDVSHAAVNVAAYSNSIDVDIQPDGSPCAHWPHGHQEHFLRHEFDFIVYVDLSNITDKTNVRFNWSLTNITKGIVLENITNSENLPTMRMVSTITYSVQDVIRLHLWLSNGQVFMLARAEIFSNTIYDTWIAQGANSIDNGYVTVHHP